MSSKFQVVQKRGVPEKAPKLIRKLSATPRKEQGKKERKNAKGSRKQELLERLKLNENQLKRNMDDIRGFIHFLMDLRERNKDLIKDRKVLLESLEPAHGKQDHGIIEEAKQTQREIDKTTMEIDDASCPVCYNPLKSWRKICAYVPCGHCLCSDCRKNVESPCPVCRNEPEKSITLFFV